MTVYSSTGQEYEDWVDLVADELRGLDRRITAAAPGSGRGYAAAIVGTDLYVWTGKVSNLHEALTLDLEHIPLRERDKVTAVIEDVLESVGLASGEPSFGPKGGYRFLVDVLEDAYRGELADWATLGVSTVGIDAEGTRAGLDLLAASPWLPTLLDRLSLADRLFERFCWSTDWEHDAAIEAVLREVFRRDVLRLNRRLATEGLCLHSEVVAVTAGPFRAAGHERCLVCGRSRLFEADALGPWCESGEDLRWDHATD